MRELFQKHTSCRLPSHEDWINIWGAGQLSRVFCEKAR
jgi:hypothetical protein